jgi:hypothetical protein
MEGGMITADMWDDPVFAELSIPSRLLYCWFRSCQSVLPGVVRGGVMTFAEGVRMESTTVLECLQELIEADRVLFDEPRRVLVVNEPPERPHNHNALKGWYRRWQQLPRCELAYHYIELVREATEGRWADVWKNTFGTVEKSVTHGTSRDAPIATNDDGNIRETYAYDKDSTNSENHNHPGVLGNVRRTLAVTPRSRSRSRSGSGQSMLRVCYEDAPSLWALQEQLRAGLGLSQSEAGTADLERVEAILADFSAEEAERVVRFYAAEAERDETKARYFDGFTNWRAENFARALRMAPANGAARQNGGERGDALKDPAEHAQNLSRGAVLPQDGSKSIRAILARGSGHGGNESV